MWKSFAELSSIAIGFLAITSSSLATGIYFTPRWLEQGGIAADHSPEFYWELELRKLAADFKPSQKRVERPVKDNVEVPFAEQASAADLADFEQTKASADALAKHKAARDAIAAANETTTTPLPEEAPSEFADYHRGAFAFHLGQMHYPEAEAAWTALLNRPEAERRHRSVWAAFMLGKLALFAQKPEAVKWFRMARDLAKQGFSDSLGLAADSYGWEAKSELEQGHVEKAAQLYLTQLALGDDSAIVSLKALVPDRLPIDGMMNFTPLIPYNADRDARAKLEAERLAAASTPLERAARDPLLRRLVTAHVLATETESGGWSFVEAGRVRGDRCKRWLAAVEKAGLKQVDDASQLGWVAYTAGNYDEAERWLKLDVGTSADALWLKAKLLRRRGKLADATQAMADAFKLIRDAHATPANDRDSLYVMYSPSLRPVQAAGGDLGALQLWRGEFISAFEAFDAGDMEEDAAFVAERVLTADELKKTIDQHYPAPAKEEESIEPGQRHWGPWPLGTAQRWMLARRLVREDRYEEARPYFPAKYREVLDRYVKALADGANEKLPKAKRARAWFDAAVIARFDGLELMGTEVEPDNFYTGGSFEATDVAGERESGLSKQFVYDNGETQTKNIKLTVPTTKEELQRLAKNKPSPNKRFHYRYIAAALGWKAAQLLPDNSDELADVLNTSGRWIKNDDKAADKYFQAIEHRASKSATGKEAGAKHWFVDRYGPWSEEPKEQ